MALRGRVFADWTGGLSDPFSLTERCLTIGMTALCMAGTALPVEPLSDGGGGASAIALGGGPTLSTGCGWSPSPHDCCSSERDVSDSDIVVLDFDSCSFFLLSRYPLAPALLLAG